METIARIRREHYIKGKTIKEIARQTELAAQSRFRWHFVVGGVSRSLKSGLPLHLTEVGKKKYGRSGSHSRSSTR